MNSSVQKKILEKTPLGILVVFSLLFLFEILKLTLISSRDVNYTLDWAFSEYLINYSGGFVRRGLLGELLSFLGEDLIVPAFNIFLMALFAANLGLLIYLARVTTTSFFVPSLAIVMPAGVISLAIFGDFEIFARKEAIFHCFTTYCAIQSVKYYRLAHGVNQCDHLMLSKVKILIAQIFIFSIFAMLSHEGFVFYSVPTLVIILSANTLILKPKSRATVLVAYLILILVMAGLLFFNRGTADTSKAIIASLPDGLRSYHEAIEMLGRSVEAQLGQRRGHGIVGEILIVILQSLPIIALYLTMFSFLCRKYSRYQLSSIDPVIQGMFLFLFITTSMAPYFFVSGDWIRLLSSIAVNSSLLILVFSSMDSNYFERTFFIHNVKVRIFQSRFVSEASLTNQKYSFVIILLMFWAALTFRISGSRYVGMHGMDHYLQSFRELVLFYRFF